MEDDFMQLIFVGEQPGERLGVSWQAILFDYLTEEQRAAVRPILRVLKKEAQEKLCVALIDYMEFGEAEEPGGYLLRMAFRYLTDAGQPTGGQREAGKISPLPVSHWHEAMHHFAVEA